VSGATPEELDRVYEAFGIHPLSVEDVHSEVRPKTEEFDDHTFVLLKTAFLRPGETTFSEEIHTQAVGLFVGSDWLVTMSTEDVRPVERVWEMVAREDGRMLRRGPDFTAYRVIDGIVDQYFDGLDRIEDQIETVEEDVTTETNVETLEAINRVRRDCCRSENSSGPRGRPWATSPAATPTRFRRRPRSTIETCTTTSSNSWT